jgi:hypothetical protein
MRRHLTRIGPATATPTVGIDRSRCTASTTRRTRDTGSDSKVQADAVVSGCRALNQSAALPVEGGAEAPLKT